MLLKKWDALPEKMQNEKVKVYYDALKKKKFCLLLKRIFDFFLSSVLLLVLSPIFLILAIAVKADSKGPVFFRQERVTRYGKTFRIFKFRTMVQNAEELGAQITSDKDYRITRVGRFLRGCRLDELPQLIDIWRGKMTFVGTRPEVPRYVERYTEEMWATLLLPAGVTSETSIYFKDEARLMKGEEGDADEIYVRKLLPEKMKHNLASIKKFGVFRDLKVMFMTVFAVCGKQYAPKNAEEIREEEREVQEESCEVQEG